ncbi:MAG: type IV pilin protein [Nitrosomonadales bacterium]|jgi:type IV pilus assembly protein PilE
MNKQRGFTLVELMVVVVIVGILSSIAIPSYSNYVKRGKIAEATANLASQRVKMEQYYQDNRTYLNGAACGVVMPVAPAVQYFTIACAAPTANTYTITATGIGSMLNFSYTINEQNGKTSTITAAGWTGNATCWATKQDGSC